MKKWFLVLLVFLTGCATMTTAGKLSNADPDLNAVASKYKFVVVHTRDLVSPCTTTLFMVDSESGKITKVEGGTGTSILGSLAGPAATAYAGREIGHGIKKAHPDKTNINNGNNNSAQNSAASIAGARAVSRSRATQFQGQAQGQVQAQGIFLRPRYPF